jgi:anthranilate synthase component II
MRNLGFSVTVLRNDVPISNPHQYDKIVLSPGPGLPQDAGTMMQWIAAVDGKIPILGVCLGMQAIAEYLGGTLYNLTEVKHGVQEVIELNDSALFEGLPQKIDVGLYHSWAAKSNKGYTETAISESGVIMAIENLERKMWGVQFHPESVMTPHGSTILKNFLTLK